jgi:hypothetical protein
MFIVKAIIVSIIIMFIQDIGVFVRFVFFKLIGKDIGYQSLYDEDDTDMIDKQSYLNIVLGLITVGLVIKGVVEILIKMGYQF